MMCYSAAPVMGAEAEAFTAARSEHQSTSVVCSKWPAEKSYNNWLMQHFLYNINSAECTGRLWLRPIGA